MLNFNPFRRRRASAARRSTADRRATRRMMLESMEGRLMLSGSAPDAAMFDVFMFSPLVAVDYSTVVESSLEGGPIGFRPRLAGTSFAAYVADTDASDFAGRSAFDNGVVDYGALFGRAGADLNVNIPTFFANGAGFTVNRGPSIASHFNGTSALDWADNEIQPVAIFQDNSADVNLSVPSPAGGEAGITTSRNEGGAIAIEPIIASRDLYDGVAPGERPSRSIASQSPRATDPSDRLLDSPVANDREMAAEWARAMVFEMAGGEPATVVRPISTSVRPADGESHPHELDLGSVQHRPAASGESRGAAFESSHHRVSSTPRVNHASHSAPLGWTPWLAVIDAAAPTADANAFQIVPSVHDNAIEQLDAIDGVPSDWVASTSRAALDASPLLLVIALDRAVSRQSRRAGAQASPKAPFLPRISRPAGDST